MNVLLASSASSNLRRIVSPHRQGGAVLFVALIFLILLTLLALAATSSSILQERMTGGLRNRQLALMGSETAARGGEALLATLASSMTSGNALPPCTGGLTDCVYQIRDGLVDARVQAFRTTAGTLDPASDGARGYSGSVSGLSGSLATASLAAPPRLVIEELGLDVPPSAGRTSGAVFAQLGKGSTTNRLYRITGRSEGGSSTAVRAVESVFSAADFRNLGYSPAASPPTPTP